MANRRAFIKTLAGLSAGALASGGGLSVADIEAAQAGATPRRRAMVGGRRITVVDVHAHTFVPDVLDLVKDTPLAATAKATLNGTIALGPGAAARLAYMDKEGIDYLRKAFSVRPDAEIAAHLGEVLWSQGQRDQALKVWREGLLLSADNETLQGTLKRLRIKP